MSHTHLASLLRLFLAALLAATLAGCSGAAKKAKHLAKGEQHFAAGDYEKAEIEYKNALQIDRLNPEAIARLGMIYFDQGRLGPSLMFLKTANELTPQNIEVRLRLVKAMVGLRQFDEARTLAAPLLDLNPVPDEIPSLLAEATATSREVSDTRARLAALPTQSPSVLTGLAILELKDRKPAAADTLLQRALAASPQFAPAHAVLGLMLHAKNDLPKAEQSLTAAANGSPIRSPRRLQLAQFYLQTGQVPAAKRILDDTLKQAPDCIPPRLLLADIAAREKRLDDSIALLERALALDAYQPEALLLAAQVRLAKGEPAKAVSILESAAKAYPRAPLIHHNLGLAYLANSETTKATASFAEANGLAPDFPAPILALAELNVRQRNFSPAIAALRQLLQKADIPEARLLLANAYRLQGNLDDALASLGQLTAALPNNPQLHFHTGTVLLQQGKRAEARAAFTKADELAPASLDALAALVALDLLEKQPAAARQRLDARLATQPNAARLHLLLARVLLAQSDAPGAEAALRKAIDLQPDSSEPYLTLAQFYIDRGQDAKALADLQTAVAKNPKDAKPAMLAAVLHDRQKNYPAAREHYEKALALDPKNAVAHNNLAYLLSEHIGDLDKALDHAQKARDLVPLQAENADTLGWILYKKRNYPRALALLEESATKLTDNAEAQAHFGLVLYATGDDRRALASLEAALKSEASFPSAPEAKKALALLKLDPAQGPAALAELDKALAANPTDSIALTRRGLVHERAGSTDKALADFTAALQAAPGNVNAALAAIRLHRARNDTAKALELARALRAAVPADPRVAHILGQLSYQTADYARALTLLQEASRRQPDDAAVLHDLAAAFYSVGRVADAESATREALEKAPASTRAADATRFLQLLALTANPSAPDAAKIDDTLKADPASVPALMAKAAQAESKRDTETARQCYEKALARFPDFAPAARQLTLLNAEKSPDDKKALELAAKAREAFPTDALLARAFGIIAYRTGNFSRAASLLQEASRARADDAELMYYLGLSHLQLKDKASTTRALQRALELGLKDEFAKEARRILAPPAK